MKKVLFLTFFILLLLVFINVFKSKPKADTIYEIPKNVSTKNIFDRLSFNKLKSIKKICTNSVCTYNFNDDFNRFIINHEEKVIKGIKDDDIKTSMLLKGIKIDKIYFKD